MENLQIKKNRYYRIDNIKFSACILVVLGHFYMSMVASGLCPDNVTYNLLIQSVYTFHVPLFFVCSGFLYQKSNRVHSFKSWGRNVLDKLLNLGVPYFTFSLITLIIKKIFEEDVNNPTGNIGKTLFIDPIAPYWYLYALFFLFLVIPNVKTKKQSVILLITATVAKVFILCASAAGLTLPYIINSICGRMIWFVIGMFIAMDIVNLKSKLSKAVMAVSFSAACILCIIFYREPNYNEILQSVAGLLFVTSIIIAANNFTGEKLNKLSVSFSEYFMPVYVMHTIFAAGIRILLLKLGITNLFIHSILGIAISFAGPIAVYLIVKHFRPLLFFIYPKKALKKEGD